MKKTICENHPNARRTSYLAGDDCYGCLAEESKAYHDDLAQQARDNEECEHGLSASLCAGPMHYPSDADMRAGRY